MSVGGFALGGCGGHAAAKPTRPPGATSVAPPAPAPPPVPDGVISRAEPSILPILCISYDPSGLSGESHAGTGFVTANGIVTASHVVSTCAASISLGTTSGSLARNDPAHDLALLRSNGFGSGRRPRSLELETVPPAVGQNVVVLGFARRARRMSVMRATIVGTYRPAKLTTRAGRSERLADAIVVDVDGVVPGESGAPAIDASGKVVGVLEGSGKGFAYLTPALDVRPR